MQRVSPATTTSPAFVSETSALEFDYVTLELHHLHHHQQQQQQHYCYEPTTSRVTSDDNNNDNDTENEAGVYAVHGA